MSFHFTVLFPLLDRMQSCMARKRMGLTGLEAEVGAEKGQR